MLINKYLPFAVVYFFFNALGLPFGLTWITLLSPLLYYWAVSKSGKEPLVPFLVCFVPFIIVHFMLGAIEQTYLLSVINYAAVTIFSFAAYVFFKTSAQPGAIFRKLMLMNIIFCLVAIVLYFTTYDHLLWMQQNITDGVENARRLKLFTYEASHYAMTFAPLCFYFLMQIITGQNAINSWLLLGMILLPLVLSFSIGVIGAIIISMIITSLVHVKSLVKKRRFLNLALLVMWVSSFLFLLLLFVFPENTVVTRIGNILAGADTSGKGRTTDAFALAIDIASQKSLAFGVGAGHIKIIGADIIKSFYLYDPGYDQIAIPNAAAETLAIFGWIGLVLRIGIQVFLFFFTRVWTNYFRLAIFLFIFLYQFTGSFVTNVSEYVAWILAFTNIFPEFDVSRGKKNLATC